MNKIENHFVKFLEGVKLAALGFKEHCIGYIHKHDSQEQLFFAQFGSVISSNPQIVWIPLYSQAFEWFRTKHKLVGTVDNWNNGQFFYSICKLKGDVNSMNCRQQGFYDTYEEAQLECLRRLIKFVTEK